MNAVDVLAVFDALNGNTSSLKLNAQVEQARATVAEQQQWIAHLESFIGPSALPGLRSSFAEGKPAGGAKQ